MDIKNQDFKKVMRGYDPVEVNTFLEMLSNEVERLIGNFKESSERVKELETQLKDYRQVEKSLQQALLHAQESAVQAHQQAQKEGEIIIKEAKSRGEEIVMDARHTLLRVRNEIEEFKTIRETSITRLKLLLNSQLELIQSLESDKKDRSDDMQGVTVGQKSVNVDEVIDKIDQE
jgi:cell division initiation protein